MKLFTKVLLEKLLENGRKSAKNPDFDPEPVVKLFMPEGAATWLLTEIDPTSPDIAFGLCDSGMGCPELDSVSISELRCVRTRLGLPVERDLHFTAKKPISEYAKASSAAGRIVYVE